MTTSPEATARLLQTELATRGWRVGAIADWRDTGWGFACERDAARMEVVIARSERVSWFLQVAPVYQPGALGKLLRRPPSASPDQCHELANVVHEILAAEQAFATVEWRWAGPPRLPVARLLK